MSGMSMRERLKARRDKLKEATANNDAESSHEKAKTDEDETQGEEIEGKDSESLISDIRKRRRQAKKELNDTKKDEEADNSAAQKREKVKRRLRDRIQNKTGTDADNTVSAVSRNELEDDATSTTTKSPGSTLKEGTESRRLRGSMARSGDLRATLREKIKAAKAKGKDEAYDEARTTNRKLRGQRTIQRKTRFDDPSLMKKEDYEIEQQLEKSIAARSKWKQSVEKKNTLLPSQQEAYDFFTMVWEPEPAQEAPIKKEGIAKKEVPKEGAEDEPEEAQTEEPGTSKEGVEEEDGDAKDKTDEDKKKKTKKEEKKEDEQPLLEDYDDTAPASWEFYQVGRAEYKPFHERIQEEDKIYFAPSVRAAPTQDKVFELAEPRYLEEEGFYVGEKPAVPSRNLNRMENRLLKQKDENAEWFGEDGRLIVLPDPLKEVPSRPHIPEEPDPLLELEFKKPEMTDFDTRLIDGSLEGSGRYQLDVDINTLVFTHHHLFSLEHVMAAKLTSLYNDYIQRSRLKRVPFLSDKLKALKNAASHVLENINLMKEDNKTSEKALHDQENRLREYKDEVKLTRNERENEMAADRRLMKHIIDTWRELKKLRKEQGFNITSLKLTIQKETTDKEADEREWSQDIEDELDEMKLEAELDHQRRMEEYKTDLEAWKKQKQLKKEAKKRQAKRDGRQGGVELVDESEEDLLLEENDQRILAEEELEKPEKPTTIDVAGERVKIRARYQKFRRQPGEPNLYPELSSGAVITQSNLCPRGEQQRRNDISRYKIFVKVLFNNKEVSRTPAKPLGQDFTVRFAQIFNVQIVQWPEDIKIQVFESATLSTEMLAEVFALIPDANVTSETVKLDDMEFSSQQRISHSHNAVGSGVNINMDEGNVNVVCLNTTGELTMGVSWAINEEGMVLVPPTSANQNVHSAMKAMDAVAALGAAGLSDINQLNKWIAQSRLDPNDPGNADLMHMVKPGAGGDLQVQGHFRLEHLQEEFNFVEDDYVDKNRRFQAIRYRNEGIPQFKGITIPALDREIPDSMFDEYEKKRREEEKIRLQDITSHRIAVTKFMQHVREQVMNRFRKLQSEKTLPDMVYEDAVPNIGTIIPNLLKITEPRRPLKPVRKERKKMTAQNLKQEDVRLLINIVRAFDIPVRADTLQKKPKTLTDTQGTGTFGGDTFNRTSAHRRSIKNIAGEVLVRPFVEVMFQRNTQSTSVAEGPNPSWNEELQIPFRPPNDDFSTSSLQTVKDSLFINLFDENVVDVLQDDRERGTSIHRRIERRWLGNLKIPFSTIYFNSRIDGTFRINKPPVLLGYQHDPNNKNLELVEPDRNSSGVDHTYVTMFITVEPQLTPAEAVKEKFETNEDDKLISEGEKWLSELEKTFPKRDYKTTVVDINGKSVFICRYFKDLAPPEELSVRENPRETAERVARFVALIPFMSDSVIFPGTCDIWSTCDQFVQMLQGDEEEHAVLLTCYFMNMKKEVYLLLGSAIPEGPTAYVLTKEDHDYWIWNASTGEHFSYRDSYCPVQRVGCLVNADNIWANIQPNVQPSRIRFDVKNTAHWKPFFSKTFRHPGLSSVQPERLIYVETPTEYVLDIQDKAERTLREKIMEWRPRHITRWNRYCIQTFKQILPKLEANRGRGSHENMEQLQQLQNSYKLSGFPINMPYTEVEPLIEAVYATGVHNNETNDVEYALAVYVHPYPCSVLSVWVYVASLSRKR